MSRSTRNNRGQCLMEVVVGSIFLIMMGLFGLDVTTLVLCEAANDHLAKVAARSAANTVTADSAKDVAKKAVEGIKTSSIITAAKLAEVNYQDKKVTVRTSMNVQLPAPFPFFTGTTLFAQSTEPVVGKPAEL